jgi:hypothetical protein
MKKYLLAASIVCVKRLPHLPTKLAFVWAGWGWRDVGETMTATG